MSKITKITAREILDSRGNPTIETEVTLDNKLRARASVPSGASTGSHEAHELRDGDTRRYGGKGVLKAVKNIETRIAPRLKGLDPRRQRYIDELMIALDGTPHKSKLGANALLGVSMAVARAAALSVRKPLYAHLRTTFWRSEKKWRFPAPMMNLINGGAHAGWTADIQEYMVIPHQRTIKEAVRCGAEIFQALKKILHDEGHSVTVGDEGGYAPVLGGNEAALQLLQRAITAAGYKPGRDVMLALDVASSEFYKDGMYVMKADKRQRASDDMIELLTGWAHQYPIESIEDGLAEDDWRGWARLTKALSRTALVGDDLFVTNVERLERGIAERVGNAILIKLNQIGTVTETAECIKLAQQNKYRVAVSHRSGETTDDFIADLAVACGADYIKTGSLSRGERVAKYNRLMEIWDEVR